MNSFFKYCLVLFLGVSYLSATLEVCEAEKDLNYEKESHAYIYADKEIETCSVKTVKHLDDLVQFIGHAHSYLIASKQSNTCSFLFYNDTPSPKSNKLYLYNSVFLI